MNGEQKLRQFSAQYNEKMVTKVNDRVLHFFGFGHSNATALIGENSVILIDCLDSDEYARRLLQEIRHITDKPVRTLIYTHGHPDHRGGAGAFRDTVEEVIAFAPQKPAPKYFDRLYDVLARRGRFQHGYGLSDAEAISQGIGIREGKETGHGKYDFLEATTIYRQKTISRTIDGVRMQLTSAPGEADDGIFVWLEDDNVICTGDNYYGCWPNLYAIRGTPYRDIAVWIDTLNEILSYPADVLLPGHTKPLIGAALIQEQVGAFRDAVEFVLLQTLECMNQGMTLNETVDAVQLPSKYQNADYLGEFYGTVEWSVKSIYTGYLGWFDGNPVNLLPVSNTVFRSAMAELIDMQCLRQKLQECIDRQEYQLALQLLEFTDDMPQEKSKLLRLRADQVTSANARHYLIAAANECDMVKHRSNS